MSKGKKQPNWNTVMTEVEVTSVLNWFNHNQTTRFAKKEFVRYLKEKQLCDSKYLKKDFDIIATDGFIASLLLQGYTLPEKSLIYFNKGVKEYINQLIEDYEEPKPKKQVSGHSNLDYKLGMVEHEIDNFFDNWESDFEPRAFLVGNKIGPNKAREYAKFYQKVLDELEESFTGKSKELKEAYSFAGKRSLNKYKKFLQKIISEFTEYSTTNRKPRKKKVKTKKSVVSKTQASLDSHLRNL